MKNANEIKLESKKIKWEPPALVSLNENNNVYGVPLCFSGSLATFHCESGGQATGNCESGGQATGMCFDGGSGN